MEIIGLTGSIGMGKSATAGMLRALKLPVFDSDAFVHNLLGRGGAAVAAVAAEFPAAWDTKTGAIDRNKLGKIVFSSPVARKRLESILHPMVWSAQRDFIAASRRAGFRKIVLDIPLLFETGSNRKCDVVLCATAPYFIQRQRVLGRTGMTEEKFLNIVRGQIPDFHKRKLSDYAIPTGLGRAFALQSLKKALRFFKRKRTK